jgi:hypothetical protein
MIDIIITTAASGTSQLSGAAFAPSIVRATDVPSTVLIVIAVATIVSLLASSFAALFLHDHPRLDEEPTP